MMLMKFVKGAVAFICMAINDVNGVLSAIPDLCHPRDRIHHLRPSSFRLGNHFLHR